MSALNVAILFVRNTLFSLKTGLTLVTDFFLFCFNATSSKFTVARNLCRKCTRVAEWPKVCDVGPTVDCLFLAGDKVEKPSF